MRESFDHRPPGGIRQSRKCCTQFIHNHMVVNFSAMSSMNFPIPDCCSVISDRDEWYIAESLDDGRSGLWLRRRVHAWVSIAAGDFGKVVVDGEATFFGQADVFVGAFGGSGEAQDGVAAGDEAVGDGIEDFVVDGVAGVFGACFAKEREGEPFADEGDVAGAVEREGYGLEMAQVLGHFFRVVIGAGAVGAGDQDHQGLCGHRGFLSRMRA